MLLCSKKRITTEGEVSYMKNVTLFVFTELLAGEGEAGDGCEQTKSHNECVEFA